MWGMFLNSLKLFFKGKLFREPAKVAKQWAIGLVATAATVVILAKLGVPLWLTIVIAAFSAGALQPWLFRDLKYA